MVVVGGRQRRRVGQTWSGGVRLLRKLRLLLMLVLGTENGLEVVNQSAGELIWGGGLRAILVLKVHYMGLPISFDNGVVKKGSIAVTMNIPILLKHPKC
jgi:hypothetical protein